MMEWIILLVLLAPAQEVRVDFEGREAAGFFHAQLQARPDGAARGSLRLKHEDPDEPGNWIVLTVEVFEVEAEETADGLVLWFAGEGTVGDRPGRGRAGEAEPMVVQVGPWEPDQDDPIWHFHSGNVYDGAQIEVKTRLQAAPPREPAGRPERSER